ncbi:MAG: histidine phosphatase family protein, partial [Okeania sp. SIO1H5]|uniref:histidine phosphatase family protein n=1 Tax=Okeania sp. SIO1H5 TaxID=2607777 RepID=UPI0013B9E7C7|nr:histidine phosphatase family protein [Okeania sp. SIO1H5]
MHKKIWVIRHGETVWNRQGRYQGFLDSPLTEKGIQQAQRLRQRLSGYRFDAIYSSDL